MTVVYPLTVQQDYTELRYSLRSVEKYLPSYEVVIVGDHMPEWLTNVTQIELQDVPNKKQLSIKRKILAALEYSEEILFMNDDVFLLRPQTFPYYYHKTLKQNAEGGSHTLKTQLEEKGKTIYNYDGHYPLIYKSDFKQVVCNFTEETIIKSMYCNYLGIDGIEYADCKIGKAMRPDLIRGFIKDKPCFSTGVYSLKSALPILNELFPQPSKYEI